MIAYCLSFSRYHIPRSWLQASNNLLVLFEETGGNPFEISVKSRYTQTICGKMLESHYPPPQNWFHSDFMDRKFSEDKMFPEMHLQCDDGHTISSIEFASFGTPQGSCQMFSQGKCHAPNSLALVSKVSMILCVFSVPLLLHMLVQYYSHVNAIHMHNFSFFSVTIC